MSINFHVAIYRAVYLIQSGLREAEALRTVKEIQGLNEDQMITLRARVAAKLQESTR